MNTTENNKIIAEFMGYKQLESYTKDIDLISYRIELNGVRVGQLTSYVNYKPELRESAVTRLWEQLNLKYHSDWNDLMEVVEKIENTKTDNLTFDVFITKNKTHIHYSKKNEWFSNIFLHEGKTKIENTYNACVEFIKWYNKENK